MTEIPTQLRDRLRSLERDFAAIGRGDRERMYASREALGGLAEVVETSGFGELAAPCEIANKILGRVLMEGALSEERALEVVVELLGYVEARVAAATGADAPGGVFHVVHTKKLGDLLVEKGLVHPDHLAEALVLQRVSKGKRVGELLVAMNVLDPRMLDQVLATQAQETRCAETRRNSSQSGSAPLPPPPPAQTGQGGLPLPPPLPSIGGSAPAPLPNPFPAPPNGQHGV